MRLAERIVHPFWVLYCIVHMWMRVAYETGAVFYLMRRMGAGMLRDDHPWITGSMPGSTEKIWSKNLIYRSPSRRPASSQAEDRRIVEGVGSFLSRMTGKSVVLPELPQGKKRRMPHAVNYLHGAVHYNGAYLIFDDFADLIFHLTDAAFRRDLVRFARTERREVTLVFRERDYDPLDYAYCVGAVRMLIPWFSNGNGPTKRPVLWGNVAPFPAIGTINGSWMIETFALMRGEYDRLVRPPIEGTWFAGPYRGTRREPIWIERLMAWLIHLDVRLHGFRGQLAFTNRDVIEPERRAEYEKAGGYFRWSACYEVPHPFRRGEREETS
jgi:hypothetical protein